MEFELDCEVIILEVEKYPILYNKGDENYKNRNARIDAWKKVTVGVIGEEKLVELEEEKLNEIGREIQKKWKALRDAYFRSLKTQFAKSGSGASKKRPYPYQQQMTFLQPVIANRQTSGNMVFEEEDLNALEVEDVRQSADPVDPVFKKPTSKPKKANFETQLIDILKAQQTSIPTPGPSDDDDNKMFLLSLLPKMRQLSENMSFEFRIKVMQCLQECYTKSKMLENAKPHCSNAQQQQHSTRSTSSEFQNQYDDVMGNFSPGQNNGLNSPKSTISQPQTWDEDTDNSVLTLFKL
ncbi:uncharacterized protein LOC124359863 [Homalodisca vitripennis]|uniref:uncharacterized protein LOC124359863 n=1 Tax=Homalodisca vitripennis TaxID=197043 RepID=UPI001EEC0198|nr:uncharacterized protein LOC124359863 [Homalodisca vitripennis]